jgi:hypothetical protein
MQWDEFNSPMRRHIHVVIIWSTRTLDFYPHFVSLRGPLCTKFCSNFHRLWLPSLLCYLQSVTEISLQSHRHVCKCYVLTWGSQHGMYAFDVGILVWDWWWCNAWELDCCTSTLSSAIHRVRFQKNLQKNTLAFKGVGETRKTINLMVPEFHTVFLFSWAPPLLLHRFSLLLPVQLLEIRYRVIIILKDFGYFYRIFWRLHFCIVKYLSFHNSSFALRYFLMETARLQCDALLVMACFQVFLSQTQVMDGSLSMWWVMMLNRVRTFGMLQCC